MDIDALYIERIADKYDSTQGKWTYKYVGSIALVNGTEDKLKLQIKHEDIVRILTACLPLFDRVFNEKVQVLKEEINKLIKE